MKNLVMIRVLFAVAALYDAVLGVAFIGFAERVFDYFVVTPPSPFKVADCKSKLID
jgi:hypothetical protein